MGQAVIYLIQFLCGYFGSRRPGQTSSSLQNYRANVEQDLQSIRGIDVRQIITKVKM